MQILGLIMLTYRELRSTAVMIGLFIIATLIWVILSFALNLEVIDGSLTAARIFGQAPMVEDVAIDPVTGEETEVEINAFTKGTLEAFVFGIETVVGGAIYWAGILLALFATAPLMPSLLVRGQVDLLLSKPISRSKLLLGRLLGVWLTALSLLIYLVGAVWIVMSVKSGIWHPRFLLVILIIITMFIMLYGIVTLISVITRSTAVSLIAAYGIIFTSLAFIEHDTLALNIEMPWRNIYLGLYHILPNFAEATAYVVQLTQGDPVENWYPLISSILFGVVTYAAAFIIFKRKDF